MPSEPSWKRDATEPGDLARRKVSGDDTEPNAAPKPSWKQEAEPKKAEPVKPGKPTAKWRQDVSAEEPAAPTAKWKQEDVSGPTAPGAGRWGKRHKFARWRSASSPRWWP